MCDGFVTVAHWTNEWPIYPQFLENFSLFNVPLHSCFIFVVHRLYMFIHCHVVRCGTSRQIIYGINKNTLSNNSLYALIWTRFVIAPVAGNLRWEMNGPWLVEMRRLAKVLQRSKIKYQDSDRDQRSKTKPSSPSSHRPRSPREAACRRPRRALSKIITRISCKTIS